MKDYKNYSLFPPLPTQRKYCFSDRVKIRLENFVSGLHDLGISYWLKDHWKTVTLPLVCVTFFGGGFLVSHFSHKSTQTTQEVLNMTLPIPGLQAADFYSNDANYTPVRSSSSDNEGGEATTVRFTELSSPIDPPTAGDRIGIDEDLTGRKNQGPDPDLLALSPETRASLARIKRIPSLSMTPDERPATIAVKRERDVDEIFNKAPQLPTELINAEVMERAPKLSIEVKSPPEGIYKKLSEAKLALEAEQNESAIAIYKEVLEKEPKNKIALFGLAVSYQKNQQNEEARHIYQHMLDNEPRNGKVLNNYLMVVGEEAPDEALAEFRKLMEKNPKISAIPAQMAMIELRRDNLQPAAKYMNQALQLAPDNIQYKYNLAIIFDRMGLGRQATLLYRQLLDAGKNGAELPETPDKIRDRLVYISSR